MVISIGLNMKPFHYNDDDRILEKKPLEMDVKHKRNKQIETRYKIILKVNCKVNICLTWCLNRRKKQRCPAITHERSHSKHGL